MLDASDLTLWRGDRRLFHRLDLCAAAGELVHVAGANGAGKTSLMRVLCGLTFPDEGNVEWRGHPIAGRRPEFHAEMAYVGHRDSLKGDLTASENLVVAVALHAGDGRGRVAQVLRDAGLNNLADLPARSLSAGQRRRLSLLRAVLLPALLWLLDEPLANLDAQGRDWVTDLIRAHCEAGGIAVITSHQPLDIPGARTLTLDRSA